MQMIPFPKVIFIDWYKTLSTSDFWEQMANPSHQLNRVHESIKDCLFVKNKEIITHWMRGEYTSEDICDILSQEVGAPFITLFNELKASCENMQFTSPGIPGLVTQLRKKGIKVVVATDNMDTFNRFTVPALHLNELFDDILLSWNLNCLKGDYYKGKLPFFDGYMKTHGFVYQDALLLDDTEDKEGNYEVLGFKRVVINNDYALVEALNDLC